MPAAPWRRRRPRNRAQVAYGLYQQLGQLAALDTVEQTHPVGANVDVGDQIDGDPGGDRPDLERRRWPISRSSSRKGLSSVTSSSGWKPVGIVNSCALWSGR